MSICTDGGVIMSRLGMLLVLVLAFIGFVAAPVSHADYRKLLRTPDGYFKKTQYLQTRERARRELDIGYDKHPSPRVRAWYRDVMSISNADQRKQLQHIFAVTNARMKYQEERADHWATAGESIARGYGDFDDFVAAYLTAAVYLELPKNGLWFVAGYVNTREGRIGHAIAIIILDGGSEYVLDNRAQRIIPMSDYSLLDPVYGVNVGQGAIWGGVLLDREGKPRKAY
jgi:predicted transglutaminase-like cysteine proteinase